jgi:hypothetical protein
VDTDLDVLSLQKNFATNSGRPAKHSARGARCQPPAAAPRREGGNTYNWSVAVSADAVPRSAHNSGHMAANDQWRCGNLQVWDGMAVFAAWLALALLGRAAAFSGTDQLYV